VAGSQVDSESLSLHQPALAPPPPGTSHMIPGRSADEIASNSI